MASSYQFPPTQKYSISSSTLAQSSNFEFRDVNPEIDGSIQNALNARKKLCKNSEFIRFLLKTGITPSIFSRIHALETPKETLNIANLYYKEIILMKNEYQESFSFEDFALMLFAHQVNAPVFSYDHHLTKTIPEILHGEGFIPDDYKFYHIHGKVFLDANVILQFIENHNPNRIKKLKQIFQDQNLNLIVPDFIIKELLRVILKPKLLENQNHKEAIKHEDAIEPNNFSSSDEELFYHCKDINLKIDLLRRIDN